MKSTKVISFSSGKGGVGKTTVVANLGRLWAARGRKTLLIDGDWSLGKLGITLGVRPEWTIDQVLAGEAHLTEAIQKVSENLFLLASPSGVVGFEELGDAARKQLFYELDQLRGEYDVILFDHGSGMHWGVLQFAAAAHGHVVVTTPEPTSYTDAYAIMKVLSRRFAIRDFQILVTQSHQKTETEKIISRFSDVCRSHLDVRLQILDILPWDARVAESIRRQKLFVDRYPDAELTDALKGALSTLDAGMSRAPQRSAGLSFFFDPTTPPAGKTQSR